MTQAKPRLDSWRRTQGGIAKVPPAARGHPRLSSRQKTAQGLAEWCGQNGAKVISPLPLKDGTDLRLDCPSMIASQISDDLHKLGFSVRFETACLQMRPGVVTEIVREGLGVRGERRPGGPLAVTTFSISLPSDD